MWFASEVATRRLAKHLCLEHCPVLAECKKEMEKFTYRGVVMAGTIWSDQGEPVEEVPKRVPCYICQKHPDWEWKPFSNAILVRR